MTVNVAQKIHCIGIGGIGVSALAALWRAQGKQVSGSDIELSPPSGGAPPLGGDVDLVVYSDAVPENDKERVEARQRGIPELSYAQALGQVSRQYRTIVVTGTHGKSTTTALLGLMLEAAGMDPLVIVGTKVPQWGNSNIRISNFQFPISNKMSNVKCQRSNNKPWFVVEGDDYRDHFLELQPYAVVVTNIEHDHPDYFQDLEQTVESFRKLVEKIPEGGFTLINEDDEGCHKLHSAILQNRRMIKYGRGSEIFKTLPLQVPGEFNRYNATAAGRVAIALGVPREIVEKAARDFHGVWRRFEILGNVLPLPLTPTTPGPFSRQGRGSPGAAGRRGDSPRVKRRGRHATLRRAGGEKLVSSPLGEEVRRGPITIVSDYGHHPTAIAATMKAARQFYPDRRLVLVYQPHQHSRTKHLFNDFVRVLRDAADVVIISEIYAVKGRMEDRNVSARDIVEALSPKPLALSRILYGGDLAETKRVVLEIIQAGDVIIFMGAGDIDNLARAMIKEFANKRKQY